MNILTIILLLLLLIFALNGWRRGFIKTLTSIVFFILTAALVYIATPYVSEFLKENTPVYAMIEEKCQEAFWGDQKTEEKEKGKEEKEEMARLEQIEMIQGLKIPEVLQKQLLENNNIEGYEKLAVETFQSYLVSYMANLILNIVSYVAAFILVFFLLKISIMTLDIITNLPVLKGINQILGLVFGCVQGIAVIWILFLVITIFSGTEGGRQLLQMIEESPVLEYLYDHNLFLTYLLQMILGI